MTCCFWFKGTHLVSLMPDHQPLLFISSVDLPFISPSCIPLPLLTSLMSFSLFLGHCQHVAFSGSHGVRLNTLMLLPSCVLDASISQDYKMFAIKLTTCNFFHSNVSKTGGIGSKPHETIETHPWFRRYDEGSIPFEFKTSVRSPQSTTWWLYISPMSFLLVQLTERSYTGEVDNIFLVNAH